jgi:hypothetical protein
MELRLYGDYGWQRPTNFGCDRGAQRRWTLYCFAAKFRSTVEQTVKNLVQPRGWPRVRAEWSMPRFLASLQSCVYHWAAPIVMRESTL